MIQIKLQTTGVESKSTASWATATTQRLAFCAGVVAQLIERSVVRIQSSAKFILNNVYCQLYWKDKNKEKGARNVPFKNRSSLFYIRSRVPQPFKLLQNVSKSIKFGINFCRRCISRPQNIPPPKTSLGSKVGQTIWSRNVNRISCIGETC